MGRYRGKSEKKKTRKGPLVTRKSSVSVKHRKDTFDTWKALNSALPTPRKSVVESSLLSGVHGRQRRNQRKIPKVSLQMARRYGLCENARGGCLRYTFGGCVFIYNPDRKREITSYPVRNGNRRKNMKNKQSPTDFASRRQVPLCLEPKYEYTKKQFLQEHQRQTKIQQQLKRWNSHTVIVVDFSGSMRQDDVLGAACRSDAVFLSLAKDFCAHQLNHRLATNKDVVSVILFQEKTRIISYTEPIDWVWYNKCLEWRDWRNLRPMGPGHYGPAITAAKELLDLHKECPLHCLFLSDGVPSDRGDFPKQIGDMARECSERLTLSCIGVAKPGTDFQTLRQMVEAAEGAGIEATLDFPKLTIQGLSGAIKNFSTITSTSRSSVASPLVPKRIRTDILYEPATSQDDESVNDNWTLFRDNHSSQAGYIRRIWKWDDQRDDFVYLMDPRCVLCYSNVGVRREPIAPLEAGPNGLLCPNCKACFICNQCWHGRNGAGPQLHASDCDVFQRDRRSGTLVNARVPVANFGGALKRSKFAQGAERIVHKFRFLQGDAVRFDSSILWVAKQSKFVEKLNTHHARMDYHQQFMRAQAMGQSFALRFNRVLDDLMDDSRFRWIRSLPRIRFLVPFVVELVNHHDPSEHETNMLVEPMLQGRYTKFNNNMGYVRARSLDAIREDCDGSSPHANINDDDFPQAFSHFTYVKSGGKLLVVDLQGELRVNPRDGTREFVLTDPALHSRQATKLGRVKRRWRMGRTDRGSKGVQAFLSTHECTAACRLFGLPDVRKKRQSSAVAANDDIMM